MKTSQLPQRKNINSVLKDIFALGKGKRANQIKDLFSLIKKIIQNEKDNSSFLKTASQILNLYQSYSSFKKKDEFFHQNHFLPFPRTEEEKEAYRLYNRKETLLKEEKIDLRALLKKIDANDRKIEKNLYSKTSQILQKKNINNEKENALEMFLPTSFESQDIYEIHPYYLAASRFVLEEADQKQKKKITVSVLIGMHKELNRLKTRSEQMTGEDFFRRKIDQLSFLFKGLENIDWRLCFVEDEPKGENNYYRTIDAIKNIIETDPKIENLFQNGKILILDYEKDLKEEIKEYGDHETSDKKNISELTADEFARESIKGGAIQTGLRYLSKISNDDDILLYTDCDISYNLSEIGLLLEPILKKESDFSVGSRSMETSYIIGKEKDRQTSSYVFNTLVQTLLNLPFKDTQAGAKAFKVSGIKKIESSFSELGMAFDVELLKLCLDSQLKGKEIGIVWIDSGEESQSNRMEFPMFQALLGIVEKRYKFFEENEEKNKERRIEHYLKKYSKEQQKEARDEYFQDVSQNFKEHKNFEKIINLSSNSEWSVLIKYFKELYDLFLPEDFKELTTLIKKTFIDLSNNELKAEEIQDIIELSSNFIKEFNPIYISRFLLEMFPTLKDAFEVIMEDPLKRHVIIPLLFGDTLLTKPLMVTNHVSFSEYLERNNSEKNQFFLYDEWVKSGELEKFPEKAREKIGDPKRLRIGQNNLLKLDQEKMIGLCLKYKSSKTEDLAYAKKIVQGKMEALDNFFSNTKIKWKLYFIDADKDEEANNDVRKYISELCKTSFNKVEGENIYIKEGFPKDGKAKAVQYGMSKACEEGYDYVGYIDFSDKIDIREMGNLIVSLIEDKADISIGSRRLDESEVKNKPVTMLIRSAFFNFLVRSMFPHLSHLTDTQAGFKLFKTDVWKGIENKAPKCEGFGFDIELLQIAALHNYNIKEHPINFHDNFQNKRVDLFEDMSTSMFDDALKIRADLSDILYEDNRQLPLIGAGAENAVYLLPNGTILKVPHEVASPYFVFSMKHGLFKNKEEMSIEQQEKRLIDNSYIHKILNSKTIKKYIVQLRNWKPFNAFVMQVISSIEKKDYKSIGYEIAKKLGDGLVIPFEEIQTPFECKINGKDLKFLSHHQVKQSLRADKTFKEALFSILEGKTDTLYKKNEIENLINKMDNLNRALWKRGLFDLDTNMVNDTGFYKGSLMLLDPGELMEDISLINSKKLKRQIQTREDYLELDGILSQNFAEIDKGHILYYYISKMEDFVKYVEEEKNNFNLGEVDFASEQKGVDKKVLEIKFPKEKRIEIIPEKLSWENNLSTEEKFIYSSSYYQLPYIPSGYKPPILSDENPKKSFYHFNLQDREISNIEENIKINKGSVISQIEKIKQLKLLDDEEKLIQLF